MHNTYHFFFISLACSLCSDVTLFLQAKKQLCQGAINEGVLAKLPVTVRVTFICPCCKWKNNALLPNPLLTKATLAPFPPPPPPRLNRTELDFSPLSSTCSCKIKGSVMNFFFLSGVIHLIANLSFQIPVGILIEREIGWVSFVMINKGFSYKIDY